MLSTDVDIYFPLPYQMALNSNAHQHPEAKPLIKHLLSLTEQIVKWQFSHAQSYRYCGGCCRP